MIVRRAARAAIPRVAVSRAIHETVLPHAVRTSGGASSGRENRSIVALTSSPTRLADARLFAPDVYEDERGYFKETYSTRKYRALGLDDEFVQDSVSRSKRNVVRGMHYDLRMSKLVHVLHGTIFDVVVDLRRESPTFLRWEAFELSGDNHRQLYVPVGFAHGFLTLTDDVIFAYKHGALYDPASEGAIRWNDPALGIAWPLAGEPFVTAKDRDAPLLRDSPFAR